jgi:hypothetical protein
LSIASLLRQRRPERGIDPAAHHGVEREDRRQHQPRQHRSGEQLRHRHLDGRTHHHQHDAWRNQDAERSAGRDQSGRQLRVVAGADHRLACHDAEDGHRGTDDAGGGSEDGRHEHDGEIERAAHAGEQLLDRVEQAVHELGLLHHDAHEHEQRHGGERLLAHGLVELEGEQVEDELAEAPIAEHEAEEDQREGDGKADEDGRDHGHDHHQADDLVAHCCGHLPARAA